MNENKFSPRAEEALRLSQEAAGELGHGYVGTEHLLAGILREGNNMAVRILRTAGVDARHLYTALMQKLGEMPRSQAADPGRRKCISGQAIAHNEDNTYRKNVQRNQQLILPKRRERIRQQSRLDRQHRQSKQYTGKREHQNCSNG